MIADFSSVSMESIAHVFDPVAFRELLENSYEVTNLELVERQLGVLSVHIVSLKVAQANGTVTQ